MPSSVQKIEFSKAIHAGPPGYVQGRRTRIQPVAFPLRRTTARSLHRGEFFSFVVLSPVLPRRKPGQWLLLHWRDPTLLLHLGMTLSVGLVE